MNNFNHIKNAIMACVALFASFNVAQGTISGYKTDVLLAQVEAIAVGEAGGGCISGGEGASECSIEGGIEVVGVGGSVACSVGCIDGYYACCSISGCSCIRYPKEW